MLKFVCGFYTVLRNLIWLTFLALGCWRLLTSKVFAFNPIPVEIHIPTGEDFEREYGGELSDTKEVELENGETVTIYEA